jgi:hypothetical protein
MIKKLHIGLGFNWFDFWIGFFIDRPGKALYICLLPMLTIKVRFTEHKKRECGQPMQKTACDTGDFWELFWYCEECHNEADDESEIEWPFPGNDQASRRDMERLGFEVV